MLAEERRDGIVKLLRANGAVTVNELSRRFGVVPITIRRDLELLEERGFLSRIHGGAVSKPEPFLHRPLTARETLNQEAKARIAQRAAAMVENGETLILDEGSTCIELARALTAHQGITVVTNGIKVAMELCPYYTITTLLVGGICSNQNYVAYGADTVETFRDIRAHKYFMGIDALQVGYGLSDGDPHQAALKQAKAASAAQVIGIADNSKIGKIGVVHVGSFGMLDCLVTNAPIQDSFRQALAREQVELIVAD